MIVRQSRILRWAQPQSENASPYPKEHAFHESLSRRDRHFAGKIIRKHFNVRIQPINNTILQIGNQQLSRCCAQI